MTPWLSDTLILIAGLGLLGVGGESLVRGATRLARTLGISPLVIGLTVVAFGTSAPEAAVTVIAAGQGSTQLAVGNIVGSNIANILLILGIAAVIAPLPVSRSLIRVDGPAMIVAAVLFAFLAIVCGQFDRWMGVLFLAALVIYTICTYRVARREPPAIDDDDVAAQGLRGRWWYNLGLIVVGIAGLVYGANLIVSGASGLARLAGISEHVIGLTIVAIGTSLPELATAIIAARHKQPDIAIGNVVGSNIFNIFFVTGLASITNPLPVPPGIQHIDAPIMAGVCLLFYPVVYTGRKVTRIEGIVLLAMYATYLTWTGFRAT